ncbi:helix-turn-helix domain-containing protein [Aminipila terrae]|uniref:Helix-turn-helix domain-containing protein n=1 Tax=Aminipila terrae TaxID=2697030 RepID=A0A6P1MGH1_9FIRM|nr:helix-turn-helix transcriptional regulator [Aminipila terrae]QHI73809.1 helix-turn-helix domain-containing protein [Aminipila terrae]
MDYRNIYQIARESSGFTQEKAAELLNISVESLRAYEGDRRVPPDKTVIRMIELYNTQYLAYQHLKTNAEVGKAYLPDIELKDLPTAMLRLQKEVTDFIKCKDELIDITCDGIIDNQEMPRFKEILKELDDITAAIYSLKFAKPLNDRREIR